MIILGDKSLSFLSHMTFYFNERISVWFSLNQRAVLQMASDVIIQQAKLEESLERIIARKVSFTAMFHG